MFATLRSIGLRLAALLTGVCLIGLQGGGTLSVERDNDADAHWNGVPLAQPDSPGEAMAFRLRNGETRTASTRTPR